MEERRKMKKTVLYVALLVLAPFMATSAFSGELKIGFVNAQKVLESSQDGKQIQEKMEEFVSSRQKIIDLEEKELKELEAELRQQMELLSPEAKRTRQEEFQRKLRSYQKKARDLNVEVQGKKIEALKSFNRKMEIVIRAISEKEGHDFVLDTGHEGGVVLFAKESYDITAKVITTLDETFTKK
jgi:outer membrane protein